MMVREPSVEASISILRGLKDRCVFFIFFCSCGAGAEVLIFCC